MRVMITKPEWDKGYYHSAQRPGQQKITAEPEMVEIQKVATVLRELKEAKFIPQEKYDLRLFSLFRNKVHENFFIFWTAINPPMERLLYALSYILQPRNILGIGIFTGNPLVWSLGPAIDHYYTADKLVGVEIDQNNARLCQENIEQVRGDVPVRILPEDGFDVLDRYEDGEVDLLYLDANGYDPDTAAKGNSSHNTKNINTSLLKKAYSKIRDGGYAFCHNAYQPSFQKDAADYLAFTNDRKLFTKTATIGIDEMGLEFSIKN